MQHHDDRQAGALAVTGRDRGEQVEVSHRPRRHPLDADHALGGVGDEHLRLDAEPELDALGQGRGSELPAQRPEPDHASGGEEAAAAEAATYGLRRPVRLGDHQSALSETSTTRRGGSGSAKTRTGEGVPSIPASTWV